MCNQIVGLPLLPFADFDGGHLLLLLHNFDFGFVESLLLAAVVLVILLHLSYIVLYINYNYLSSFAFVKGEVGGGMLFSWKIGRNYCRFKNAINENIVVNILKQSFAY